MKVLMISPYGDIAANYGVGVATQMIAQHLANKCELTVVSPSEASSEVKHATIEKVMIKSGEHLTNEKAVQADIVHVKVQSPLSTYVYTTQQETKGEKSRSTPQPEIDIQKELAHFTETAVEQLSKLEYDVIYAHDWLSIDIALQLQAQFNKAFVLHIHSLDYDRSGKNSGSWLYKKEKEAMEKANKVLAVSEYHADIMKSYYQIPENKIVTIPLALSPIKAKTYTSPFSEKLVLFSGRLSHQKGIFKFIDIAESLLETEKDLRFIVAGAGELSEEAVSRVQEKGLMNHFNFVGRISQEELQGLMKSSELFVMPSISEPFGLVAMEAAAQALPIVMSKNTGAAEVLKGAYIPKEESVSSYVNQIKKVLSNKEKVAEAIKKNKQAAKDSSWETVAEAIYQSLSN